MAARSELKRGVSLDPAGICRGLEPKSAKVHKEAEGLRGSQGKLHPSTLFRPASLLGKCS